MKWVWCAALLTVFIALRFEQPIEDGDLFWHMRYATQMLERGTLATDHSLYSWMPASNAIVYCAWTAELLFLAIWKTLGLAGIFALRYAAVLIVAGLLAWHARRLGMLARTEVWLAILIVLLGSMVATLPKPEMLSLVLWNALVFCWFGALSAARKLAWIYALPIIMLVWVNTHGAFLLALPFLVVSCIGGFVLFARREALHLALATALCCASVILNPYGIRYPYQLAEFALHGSARPDIGWNNAFQPTFGAAGSYLHLPELLAWMMLAFTALLFFSRARERWVLAALFAVYVPLFYAYVRSTFLLPAIFGYSAIFFLRDIPSPRLARAAAFALMLFLATRSVYAAAVHPTPGSWLGFGISDLQPVQEAEFIASHNLGPRLYNTYNVGGYLLWRLWPRARVMVDARSFPYLSWFNELVRFTRSDRPQDFQAFLERHPADAALVDFQEDTTWRSFLGARAWRPAFYGPSAAVFVPAAQAQAPVEASPILAHLRNGDTASRVFAFSIAVADYRTAWSIHDQMRGPLRRQVPAETLAFADNYRQAHAALAAHDYAEAWTRFERAFEHRPISGRDNDVLLLLRALQRIQAGDTRAAVLRAGLDRLTMGAMP